MIQKIIPSFFKNNIVNDLELYDKKADSWWTPGSDLHILSGFNEPRFQYFNKFIPCWKNLKVLDVGSGGGFTCEYLCKQGAHVTGVERSLQSVRVAQKHAIDSGLDINYLHGTGEVLPLDSEQFDVVTCLDVLEHVEDVGQVISEIQRVLKPGGRFLFDTINKTFLSKVAVIWFMEDIARKTPKGTHDWNMFIAPETLKKTLMGNNFSQIEMAGFSIRGFEWKTNKPIVKVTNNLSVLYIGKAEKTLPGVGYSAKIDSFF